MRVISIFCFLLLAGCSGFDGLTRSSEVEFDPGVSEQSLTPAIRNVTPEAATETAAAITTPPLLATEDKPGLFRRIFPKRADAPAVGEADVISAAVADVAEPLKPEIKEVTPESAAVVAEVPETDQAPNRRGLFGGLFRNNKANKEDVDEEALIPASARSVTTTQMQASLQGREPYGRIVKLCGVKESDLGSKLKTQGGFA